MNKKEEAQKWAMLNARLLAEKIKDKRNFLIKASTYRKDIETELCEVLIKIEEVEAVYANEYGIHVTIHL